MNKKKNIRARVQNFHKRWNTEYYEGKRITDFRSRILSTIDIIIRPVFAEQENLPLLINYFKLIGVYVSVNKLFMPISNYIGGYIFQKTFESKIENATLEEVIFYIQQLFYLDMEQDIKYGLYEEIKEDIESSLLDIRIKKTKTDYILYPAGAKLLDDGVVNDVLDWLSDYPKVYKNFRNALKQYEKHEFTRNIVDNLRFSLESLLKDILHNHNRLEKQKDEIGKYLEGKEIPREIRNMFNTLITQYTHYQNEHAKHNDSVKESEIEFMIYLTGTFMRFILKLKESSESVIKEK